MVNDRDFFRIDEFEDVVHTLKLVIHQLDLVDSEPAAWKWIILGVHNALQGACVAYLTDTAGVGALTDEPTALLLAKLDALDDSSVEWPPEKLARWDELLNRVRKKATTNGQASFAYKRSLERLERWRNELTHFKPRQHSSYSRHDFWVLVENAVDCIGKIADQPNWSQRNRFADTDLLQVLSRIRELTGRLRSGARIGGAGT